MKTRHSKLTPGARKWAVEQYVSGVPSHKIADALGVSAPSIRYHIRQAGVQLRPVGRPTVPRTTKAQVKGKA